MSDVSPIPAPLPPERFDDGVYLHALETLQPEKPTGVRWKRWVIGAALVLFLAALPPAYWWVTGTANRTPSLALSVEPAGSDLLIAWAGGAQHARISKLKVREDGSEEEFDLRPSYETAGTLVYHPKTSHVHVTWSVDAGGRFYGKEADYLRAGGAASPTSAATPIPTKASKQAHPAGADGSEATRNELEHLRAHDRRMEALVKALRARGQEPKEQ